MRVLVFSLWCVCAYGMSVVCAYLWHVCGVGVFVFCLWCTRAGGVVVVYVWRSEDDGGEHPDLDADLARKFIFHT